MDEQRTPTPRQRAEAAAARAREEQARAEEARRHAEQTEREHWAEIARLDAAEEAEPEAASVDQGEKLGVLAEVRQDRAEGLVRVEAAVVALVEEVRQLIAVDMAVARAERLAGEFGGIIDVRRLVSNRILTGLGPLLPPGLKTPMRALQVSTLTPEGTESHGPRREGVALLDASGQKDAVHLNAGNWWTYARGLPPKDGGVGDTPQDAAGVSLNGDRAMSGGVSLSGRRYIARREGRER